MFSNKKVVIIFTLSLFIVASSFSILTYNMIKSKVKADSNSAVSTGDLSPNDNSLINNALDDLIKTDKEASEDLQKRRDEWIKKINLKQLDFATLKGSIIKGSGKDIATTDIVEKPDFKGQLATDPKLRIHQFVAKAEEKK